MSDSEDSDYEVNSTEKRLRFKDYQCDDADDADDDDENVNENGNSNDNSNENGNEFENDIENDSENELEIENEEVYEGENDEYEDEENDIDNDKYNYNDNDTLNEDEDEDNGDAYADPDPDVDAYADSDPEAYTDFDPDADANSVIDIDAGVDAEVVAEVDADADVDVDDDDDVVDDDDDDDDAADAYPDSDVDADPEADVDADPEADIDADPEADVDADPASDVDADPEADVDADPEADGDADPEADGDADPEADADADIDVEAEAEAGADVDGDDNESEDGDRGEKETEEVIPSKRPRLDNNRTHNDNKSNNAEKTVPESSQKTQMGFGARMLEKFGHTRGKGLGKYEQGRVEPLKASDQKGKRGFGYHPEESQQKMEFSKEERISLYEEPIWLENPFPYDVSETDLWKFMEPKKGPPKKHIHDEIEFCNPEVLHNVLKAKSDLDHIENVGRIRSRINPFESIKNGIFLNRAAMKMANIDRVFDYMFTNPQDKNGVPIINRYDLLYFADVCAGPGGFSEYVFYRKKWRAKGFGFTLKKENDFKLDEFFAGPCETFEPHYGVPIDGDTGDGDVFKAENIEEFSKFVMENTDNEGVHFMMADGGFPLDDLLLQEVRSKQLYLCQCLVALKIVRMNGNFVVKLFDLFTPFSVGLIYLMYRSFDRISIHKPNSSRPANSERYLICQYKRNEANEIAEYLTQMNALLSRRHSTGVDVLELVPISHLKDDIDFFEYIVESNTRIGERQVFHLQNIVRYANTDICDSRQENFKEECLKYWNIPNTARTDPKKGEPNRKIEQLFRADDGFLYKPAKEVDLKLLTTQLSDRRMDWYWMILENGKQSSTLRFYLGLGRTNVYSLEGKRWCIVDRQKNFQLPEGTLLYGEIAEENVYNPNSLKGQYRVPAFHIVDALFLGGEDIRYKHITERRKCCELFAKSLTHSNIIYRVKKLYEYNELYGLLSSSLQLRTLKNGKRVFGFDISYDRFVIPKGLLFFCGTKGDWYRNKSSRENQYYFFNKIDKKSVWEKDVTAEKPVSDFKHVCADFVESFSKRMVWWVDENDLSQLAKKEG